MAQDKEYLRYFGKNHALSSRGVFEVLQSAVAIADEQLPAIAGQRRVRRNRRCHAWGMHESSVKERQLLKTIVESKVHGGSPYCSRQGALHAGWGVVAATTVTEIIPLATRQLRLSLWAISHQDTALEGALVANVTYGFNSTQPVDDNPLELGHSVSVDELANNLLISDMEELQAYLDTMRMLALGRMSMIDACELYQIGPADLSKLVF